MLLITFLPGASRMNSGRVAPADNFPCNLFVAAAFPELFSLIAAPGLEAVSLVVALGLREENLQLIDTNVHPLHE